MTWRYVVRRVGLSIVTLFLVITIVFMINNVFPSDIGRRLAGPFQSQEIVDQINEELGTNDPLIEQYGRMLKGVFTFDWGDSYVQNKPVSEVIGNAFWRSMKLALYGLVLTIPLSIAAGIFAARRQGKTADRAIVTLGLASSSIPEFVSCVILQVLIGWKLGWFHVTANPPAGSSFLTQLSYLTLPALALVVVYFGYIARMTRAGVIRALDSDYTRTATMKGLPTQYVIRRHVLRNGLQPTVSVIGVQVGYVLGSLVAIEKIFNYPGLGLTIANAAAKDPPVLVAGVLVVAVVYMLGTLAADLVLAWMNPRASIESTTQVMRVEGGV
jgi:peptide/nickel transport system permease protein